MNYFMTLFLMFSLTSFAEDYGKLIFQDDFERNESNEKKEEPGNGWISNSKSRAKGNKQLDLREGALYIYTHAEADHAAVARHKIGFQNGTISMKFKFESAKDNMNINIADMKEKSVHAGHLFNITLSPSKIALTDLKTGNMKLEHREARKNKKASPELKKMLSKKSKVFKSKLELNKWHKVVATINGNEITCTVNGKKVGSFQAEGFAHPIKQEMRLIVNKNAFVDEIRVWKKN